MQIKFYLKTYLDKNQLSFAMEEFFFQASRHFGK